MGIGTRVPLAKMHVEHTTDDTDENGNIALTVGGGASGAVRHYWGINNPVTTLITEQLNMQLNMSH